MANYLIIGGSSGIGKQLAEDLANAGHQVYATYCKTAITTTNPLLQYHYLDVMATAFAFDFLPDTLDGFVYCPGSIHLKPFERIKAQDFAADYQLQVLGAIQCLQAVLPRLKKSTQAAIVFFSTVAVQNGFTFHTQVASSKGAIEGLCKALAAEYAPNIRVNCIAPSLTDTPLAAALINTDAKKEANALRHPLKKIGTAIDIANMASFLLSDKAAWITGQIMHVDGGMSSIKM